MRDISKNKKTESGLYKSKIEADKRYSAKFDDIRVRVPKGTRQLLQEYVAANSKYTSVNQLINDLISEVLKK